jgi:Domain of unknown function (DUF6531)
MRLRFLPIIPLLISSVVAVAQVEQPDNIFKSAHDTIKAADPFDVGTGIYFREYRDLYIEDTIPIDFVRTQRNMDPRSRSFGVGASTSYDMFIVGDVYKFSWVALVLADGSQDDMRAFRRARASPTASLRTRPRWISSSDRALSGTSVEAGP